MKQSFRAKGLPLPGDRTQEGIVPAQSKFLLALLPMLAATAAVAQQQVAPGQFVAWTQKDGAKTISTGGTQATITAAPCDKGGDVGEDCYRAKIAVTVAGKPPVTLFGEPGIAYRVAIGRLSAGDSGASVVLQSFTGGAHCCDVFTIAEPIGDTVQVVPVTWQPKGESKPRTLFDFGDIPFPADLNGDGRADIVLRDDRFLYAFESYAGSMAPPIVLSIADGKVEDITGDPRLAPVFEDAMRRAEAICTDRAAFGRNGACAAYVADAARLGRFDAAWRVMMRVHDRHSPWPLDFCLAEYVDGKCPEGSHKIYRDLPTALRAFLVRTGYIAG
jgi:hypothetical protein